MRMGQHDKSRSIARELNSAISRPLPRRRRGQARRILVGPKPTNPGRHECGPHEGAQQQDKPRSFPFGLAAAQSIWVIRGEDWHHGRLIVEKQ
jgi:hypothetical protein